MKKNILLRTNLLVCLLIMIGFLLTAVLSYQANYSAAIQNIEQVSTLTSEGIYYQISSTFTKPVNVSLTMANDSLLKGLLRAEADNLHTPGYIETVREYLHAYQVKYGYDSVFLVSAATRNYYNFNGLDRVIMPNSTQDDWYYDLLASDDEYRMNVDTDKVEGAGGQITVFVDCKIKDAGGDVLGIVGVGLRIDDLQELLRTYQQEFDVSACLINAAGMIQISSAHTGYETVDLFDVRDYPAEARSQILNWKQEGTARSFWEEEGDKDYVVTRYLPELDWHLVVERNTESLMLHLRQQMTVTVFIILCIITFILLIISYVIRSFNRQIVMLTESREQERRTVFERATEQLFENIYEIDITNNCSANHATEQYFASLGAPPEMPFSLALRVVAEKQIKEEFRQGYIDTFSPENVRKAFHEGQEALRYDCMVSNGGAYYWMRIIARIVQWESDGSIHLLTYRQNIDAERQQEDRMRELAYTDEMTGIRTKTATQRSIEVLLREHPDEMYAFFIFDIDNFKQANDQFGHAFGDTVIKNFVRIIQAHFRRNDVIGRIGGDEFVAFIPVPDAAWAQDKAQELSAALDQVYASDGKSWHMSASIGVAFAPRDGADFAALYRNADTALYRTKESGRNGITLYRDESN